MSPLILFCYVLAVGTGLILTLLMACGVYVAFEVAKAYAVGLLMARGDEQ